MKNAVFLNWLLDQIDLKKKESLDSASKTDLYSDGDMTSFCVWIDDIKGIIQEYPPVGYASQIILTQDDNGSLTNVRYVYSNSADIPSFVEIVIDYDNKRAPLIIQISLVKNHRLW